MSSSTDDALDIHSVLLPARIVSINADLVPVNLLPYTVKFTAEEVAALRASNEMALAALDDLRSELAEERTGRLRAEARNRVLEARMEALRGLVK